MKKMILAAAILIGCTLNSLAQEVAKTGLNFGPLPAVGYSSDLGWHYGALSDIYWYGDGSTIRTMSGKAMLRFPATPRATPSCTVSSTAST